jgi:regulator of PEP synthase PpsR (kinase-PPPase family)
VKLPKSLFEVDPEKVFGLTINPVVLQTIRRARAKSLGFSEEVRSNYSEMDHVREELEFARRTFAQNPVWPVIGNVFQSLNVLLIGSFEDMLVTEPLWCFSLVCDCRSDRKSN